MKNKYVTKMLCTTLVSALILTSTVGVLGAEVPTKTESQIDESDTQMDSDMDSSGSDSSSDSGNLESNGTPIPTESPQPSETPSVTPNPSETPTPTPSVTPTPEPTETPEPSETPAPTPTPGEDPGEDPGNVDQGAVNQVIDLIDALNSGDLTREQLDAARKAYDALSDEEKALVNNYGTLKNAEDSFVDDVPGTGEDTPGGTTGGDENGGVVTEGGANSDYTALEGQKVTYSGATYSVSNLHAGRDFYLDQLEDTYHLTFDDEFADVMDSIEKDYKKKNKISGNTEILVRNWQDILAVYVLRQKQAGDKSYTLDKTSKKELAEIFEELNPVMRDKKNILKISYGNLHVDDYMEAHKGELNKKEKALLNKYTSKDCALLSATVTAAKGFIRQSAGEDISEERVNVIAAGYSLVGKVSYFWGGKSTVIGWDSNWGTAATVSAGGSRSSGSVRAYGLDCSGFVTWAFVNGYEDKKAAGLIGDGTTSQWEHCETIDAKEAQPGDLVFQRGPEGGSNNHVGILVGQTEEGDWIAVHCSSGQNGVVVGEAYSASFRYIRRPAAYPTREEVMAQREKEESNFLEEVLVLNTEDSAKKSPHKKDKKQSKSVEVAMEE